MKNYTNTSISTMALSLAFLFANPLFAQNDSTDSTLGGGEIAKILHKAQ